MPSLRAITLAVAAATALLLSPIAYGGKGHGSGEGKGSAGDKHAAVSSDESGSGEPKVHGIGKERSKLAGLNSLGRNLNGLMNSSDPRMVDIRAFVQAGEDLEIAEANLATATETLGVVQETYDAYVGSFNLTPYTGDTTGYDYTDTSLVSLNDRRIYLEGILATTPDAQAEYDALVVAIGTISASSQLADLIAAEGNVELYTGQVEAGEAATSDEALTAALLVAANDNRIGQYGDTYVDADMLAWAREQLGMTE